MSNHTKGPWHVEVIDDEDEENRYAVCHPGTSCNLTTICNLLSESDARLIAAAPDLLKALKLAADAMSRMDCAEGTRMEVALLNAESAIAKAEGN